LSCGIQGCFCLPDCAWEAHWNAGGVGKPVCLTFGLAGQFQNAFPELVMLSSYSISRVEEKEGGRYEVLADVKKGDKGLRLKFVLVRKDVGRKKGALMTRSVSAV